LIVENSSVSSLRPETADAFDRFEAGGEDDQVDQVSLVAGQDGVFRHLGDRVCDQVSLVGLLSVKQGLQTTFSHCIALKHFFLFYLHFYKDFLSRNMFENVKNLVEK
jgi:hypothetical protein